MLDVKPKSYLAKGDGVDKENDISYKKSLFLVILI